MENTQQTTVTRTPDTIPAFLADYDAGLPVTSVSMGGIMGMGYELVIQEVAIAFLRQINDREFPASSSEAATMCEGFGKKVTKELDHHGMSGAQYSDGKSIALNFWRHSPVASLESLKERNRLLTLQKVDGQLVITGNVGA